MGTDPLTLPIESKALIGGAVVLGLVALGKKVLDKLSDAVIGRVGEWFQRVGAAAAASETLVVGLAEVQRAQAEMREYLCERIDTSHTAVMSRIDLVEARTTGEDRVLAGRISAMENTVVAMEERLNTPPAAPATSRRPANGKGHARRRGDS